MDVVTISQIPGSNHKSLKILFDKNMGLPDSLSRSGRPIIDMEGSLGNQRNRASCARIMV